MQKTVLLICSFIFCVHVLSAQSVLEEVTVETYYVSNAEDAATEVGGLLEEGAVTYRVFVKLAEGCKLRAVYGNEAHPFIVSSTELFFNNNDRGETWGFDIPDNRLDENTVALDSWLSFGGATDAHWGIPLALDFDGSEVGGIYHEDGLLLALEAADGLLSTTSTGVENFFVNGDSPVAVFGEETLANEFSSTNFRAQITSFQLEETENNFLVAQFTTKGELSFCLNFEVVTPQGNIIKLVGSNEILNADEEFSPFLKFPLQCGCTDPDFLEYDQAAGCDDGSCSTPIVFGCNDPEACNFNPEVNFNVPELCCILPDNCDGLNPDIICPGVVSVEELNATFSTKMYPNPTRGDLKVDFALAQLEPLNVYVLNSVGQILYELNVKNPNTTFTLSIDTRNYPNGLYFMKVQSETIMQTSRFVVAK